MTAAELTRAMKTLGMTAEQLAPELGISTRSLYYRMAGEQRIRASEAKTINMMLAAKQAAEGKNESRRAS